MKIIITGANGYLGSRLSFYLSNKGHEIIAVCRKKKNKNIGLSRHVSRIIFGDIRESQTINLIADEDADLIIHLVSLDHHESEKNPDFVLDVNVKPIWNLLEASKDKKLKRFIYFSTVHVYGNNQHTLVNESQKVTPTNAYGLTHILSEEICSYYNRTTKMECINVRLSNSYGEPLDLGVKCWDLIVNDLTKSAYLNKKIILKGDGSAIRDFIHFNDICRGIDSLLNTRLSGGSEQNTFHFSSGKSLTMLDVARKVKEVYKLRFDVDIPIYINSDQLWESEAINNVSNHCISNDLIKSYGIEFTEQIDSGINGILNYLEEQFYR